MGRTEQIAELQDRLAEVSNMQSGLEEVTFIYCLRVGVNQYLLLY